MCNRSKVIGVSILAVMTAMMTLDLAQASADPVSFSMFLSENGPAAIQPGFGGVSVTFPDFSVGFDGLNVLELNPGFCFDECGTGTSVPFTQTVRFDGLDQSTLATLSGTLRFTGPTEALAIDSPFDTTTFSDPVQFSGTLAIRRLNQVLFDGRVSGSGTGFALYDTSEGVTRLGLVQYQVNGTAVTPEPASLILLGTGVAWLSSRRRKAALPTKAKTLPTN